MKIMLIACLAAIAAVSAGCARQEDASPSASGKASAVKVAYDLGSIKKGDTANCVVCVAEGSGHGEEPAAETINYKGRTYAFCNQNEKADFISDPDKYARVQ